MTNAQQVIQMVADKLQTTQLSEALANNLYPFVPTDARKFIGLDMMDERTTDSDVIKYTALEPPRGLMKSIVGGSKAPVSNQRATKTEEHPHVLFAESKLYDRNDWKAIMQGSAADARDAEKRIASEKVFHGLQELKFKHYATKESLFWDGSRGTMTVNQRIDGVDSTYDITTNTRTIAALTGNDQWNDQTSSSTADPLRDIQTMNQSFTGKGTMLEKVYANLETFNNMLRVPALRDRYRDTTIVVEAEMNLKFKVGGVTVEVYNEGYIDDDGIFQTFIPNGTIIGMGRTSDMVNGSPVHYIKGINADAQSSAEHMHDISTAPLVYGEWIGMETRRNPVTSELLLTNVALPAFVNPQMIVSQTVYS